MVFLRYYYTIFSNNQVIKTFIDQFTKWKINIGHNIIIEVDNNLDHARMSIKFLNQLVDYVYILQR